MIAFYIWHVYFGSSRAGGNDIGNHDITLKKRDFNYIFGLADWQINHNFVI